MSLSVGDMFAGVGGIAIAFKQAGFNIEWANEYDSYACKTYRANFPSHNLIEGDVKTLDPDNLDKVDIITSGFPCFREDSLVLTLEYGYKEISKVKIGDHVLTHKGNWKKVLRVMKKLNGKVRKFRSSLCDALFATDEHPFFTRECNSRCNHDIRAYERKFDEPKWKEFSELITDDFVCSTIPNTNTKSIKSPEFWKMIGRYLANGWLVKRHDRLSEGSTIICCGHKEKEDLTNIIKDAGYNTRCIKERTMCKFYITNNELYYFLKDFGHLAHGKTLPGYMFNIDVDSSRAFLDGYFSGDWYKRNNTQYATIISEKLVYSIALLIQKCFNVVPTITKVKLPNTTVIEGRIVNQESFYKLAIHKTNSVSYIDGNYAWNSVKFKTFGTTYSECDVWNLEVEDDNSYMVNNTIVHNCQAFSIAGNRKGFEDPRGNLFFETARIINGLKPKAFLLENVKNLRAHDKGNTLKVIEDTIKEIGYSFESFVLSAYQHGNIPQSRERIYMVGFREDIVGSEKFIIPSEIPLTKKIGDLLCKGKIENKYYFKKDHKYMPLLKEVMVSKDTLYQWRRVYVRENKNKLCPTLTANMGSGGHNVPLLVDEFGYRKLIPRECFRFQGFPESFKLPSDVSNTRLYKQSGNSVTVPVIKRIADEIKTILLMLDKQ